MSRIASIRGRVHNLKWRLVNAAAESPARLGKSADMGGQVLSLLCGNHWKVGLSRAALNFSNRANALRIQPGEPLTIKNGKIYRKGDYIFCQEKLFGSVSKTFSFTEEMLSPEGMTSFLRWEVFYDRSKIARFSRWFLAAFAVNTAASAILAAVCTPIAHKTEEYTYLLEGKHSVLGIQPYFNPRGIIFDDLLKACAFNLTLFWLTSLLVSEFHQDDNIKSASYAKWSKFSNLCAALSMAGAATQQLFLYAMSGAWDFLAVGAFVGPIGFGGIFNTSDLLIYLSALPVVMGMIKILRSSYTNNLYAFPTKKVADRTC